MATPLDRFRFLATAALADGSLGDAEKPVLLRAAEHIPFAPTLGDVATLLSHPASSSHRGLSPEGRAALGISEGFIRVSVGIEEIDLLTREFGAALAAAV